MMVTHVPKEIGQYSYKYILKNMEYDLKQNLINCGLVPSLEYITIVRIAIKFWQEDMSNEVGNALNAWRQENEFKEPGIRGYLSSLEKIVLKKVLPLVLPLNCKEKLKQMLVLFGRELLSFFNNQEQFSLRNWEEINTYLANIRWTQQGKINYLKTAVYLINHSSLNEIDKYIIACNNCLEDKIRSLYKILPNDFLVKLFKQSFDDIYTNNLRMPLCLVLFWSYRIKGEIVRALDMSNEFIFSWACSRYKYVAVQYIWENFGDEKMKKSIANYIISETTRKFQSCYIILFLFKQIRNEKIEKELWDKVSYSLVNTLPFISNWSKEKYVAQYLIDFINMKNVWKSIEIIIFCCTKCFLNINEYKNISKTFSSEFEINVKENYVNIYKRYLKYFLSNGLCRLFTLSLLKMGTNEQRKEMLYSFHGMALCVGLLRLEQFDLFFNEMLLSKKEISQYKRIFFNRNSRQIYIFSNKIINYKFLDDILIKHCSKKEIITFKNELPYKDSSYILSYLSNYSANINSDLLTLIRELLSWCFEGNEEKIIRCKATIYDLNSNEYREQKVQFFNKLKILIINEEWRLVKQYWKWIFYATEEKLTSTKEKLARTEKILHMTSITEAYVQLKKFITSCFVQYEVDQLREELKCSDTLSSIVKDMLRLDKHLEVDELLQWCYIEVQEEIDEFKKSFMRFNGCELLLKLIEHSINMTRVKLLFKWFNPSVDSAKWFKETFENFVNQCKIKFTDQTIKQYGELRTEDTIYSKLLTENTFASLEILDFHNEHKTGSKKCKRILEDSEDHLFKKTKQIKISS